MSLCYNPKAKIKPHCPSQYDHGGWDVNASGADILGGMHQQLGLPICDSHSSIPWPEELPGRPFRVPYSMDEATCLSTAKKLSEISDDAIRDTFDKYAHCWEKKETAVDDYLEWVRNWQKFLEVCGGYAADQ